ncbi:hypothetical protein LEN26_019556 [Aphanomyces euteiches]|nr:hypothetical protein LEN26_019556 [Aphanomyces euteiches]
MNDWKGDWDSDDQEAIDFVLEDVPTPRVNAVHGGSRPGRLPNLEREHASGHDNLIRDYFGDAPVYNDSTFQRRFLMPRALFLRVVEAVARYDSYFEQKPDATGKLGLSTLQKCTASWLIQQLQ